MAIAGSYMAFRRDCLYIRRGRVALPRRSVVIVYTSVVVAWPSLLIAQASIVLKRRSLVIECSAPIHLQWFLCFFLYFLVGFTPCGDSFGSCVYLTYNELNRLLLTGAMT